MSKAQHLFVMLSSRERPVVEDAVHQAVWESARFFNPGRVVHAVRILRQLGTRPHVVRMLEDRLLEHCLP